MVHKYTFSKNEHLCGEIRIAKLFTEGKAFIVYPFRIVYNIKTETTNTPSKILINVPKKRFKHAVDRNRIKRQMRECYRLNKLILHTALIEKDKSIEVGFNYVADSELDFATLNRKMGKALFQICQKI